MTRFPQESVFRIDREDAQRGPFQDEGDEWWQRSWWLASRELHEKDHGHRYYLPTPRVCRPPVEPKDDSDKRVFIALLVLFAIAMIIGVLP